jgi:hypothetical protein
VSLTKSTGIKYQRAMSPVRGPFETLSVGPSSAIVDPAVLLDPTEIGEGQAVIFHGVFSCSL